ncbi:MAG: hypothetical protein K9N06_06495 [Candidatus Cloacimonetes bacterium]|nr:hypothetical protein [Candidatus Cloacimonadota bacterium]
MAQAYSAGLTVTESITLRKERILPLKGQVLVKKGDKVKAQDLVAQTLLPGKVVPFNLSNKLGVPADQVKNYVRVTEGNDIKKGDVIAQTKGIFGLFKNTVKSPITGEIENISKITGQMLLREPRIPVQIKAFIDGIIVDIIPEEGVVIENRSAYVQGIFGIGGETYGKIKILVKNPQDTINKDDIDESCKGMICVCGALVDYDTIKKAQQVGVSALITGGIDDNDLKKLLGYNIGVAITGHEDIGISIICTEGFGNIKMAENTFNLLKKFEGKDASCHGKTQIRAGVMRPEIIVSLDFKEDELSVEAPKSSTLEIGGRIRIIRQPNFGEIGKITALPEELTMVESETLVRILEAQLDNGEKIVIPRANVEVIEE